MSDNRVGKSRVLNWRGPLLAAAIFAALFAVLLLMAHQNQSNASDEGSSLRQDPYGSSLLFDSYELSGYQVERSQDENSLADQDASRTTAFFVGGFPSDAWKTEDGKLEPGQFRQRLEDFLARGGRVVLIDPAWGLPLTSQSQGWDAEKETNQGPAHESGPGWVAPASGAMPAGTEMMYLTSDAPWLKTDARWTPLYAGRPNAIDGSQSASKADGGSPAHVYMASWRVEKGELIVASQESFLLNETIKTHPNPVLLDFLVGERPVIWVDETLHGLHQDQGVLWLVARYRLQAALLLFWAALLALLWSMSGDLLRLPACDPGVEIIRYGEGAGLAGQRLLQRSIAKEQVVTECWEQFRRRSPHDAQAISADPGWSSWLRAALAQPPLKGYKELKNLITQRRASARSVAHAGPQGPDKYPASPKTTPEEARIE
ncbi:MAG: DUF4350 domain-containing protein [Candidatus Acidiferrales bacterium]